MLFLSSAHRADDLNGSEDPNILHAFIATLPSRHAYKEGRFEETRFSFRACVFNYDDVCYTHQFMTSGSSFTLLLLIKDYN